MLLCLNFQFFKMVHGTVYDYRQGDFTGLRTSLECLSLESLVTTNDNINHDWQGLEESFPTSSSTTHTIKEKVETMFLE